MSLELVLDLDDLNCEHRDGNNEAFDGNDRAFGIDLLAEEVLANADGLVIFLAAGPGSKSVEEVVISEEVIEEISAPISSSSEMAESLRLPADVVEASVQLLLSS